MSYDDVEIEDMEWNEDLQAYTYPCPCGDLFQITKEDLRLGEEIARCPSCSLYITVIYNMEDFIGDNDKKKSSEPSNQQPIAVAWETYTNLLFSLESFGFSVERYAYPSTRFWFFLFLGAKRIGFLAKKSYLFLLCITRILIYKFKYVY